MRVSSKLQNLAIAIYTEVIALNYTFLNITKILLACL